MRWEDERYVRLYTRDTVDWQVLSFEAQGLFALLLRKVDRAGLLRLGKHGAKGVAVAIGHPGRADVVDAALQELLNDGCVAIRGDVLVIPNYVEAQEANASDRARQQTRRERDRDAAMAKETLPTETLPSDPPVTKRDAPVTLRDGAVTKRDETSRAVTGGHAPSHAVTPSRAVPCLTSRASPVRDETAASEDLPEEPDNGESLRDVLEAVFLAETGHPYAWRNGDDAASRALVELPGYSKPEAARRLRIGLKARFKRTATVADLVREWNTHAAPENPAKPPGPPPPGTPRPRAEPKPYVPRPDPYATPPRETP